MQLGEFRPRDRKHLRRRVQFHRARPERDHRSREREIARLQPPEIAQHLGLGVVGVENRMGQDKRNCGLRIAETGKSVRRSTRQDLIRWRRRSDRCFAKSFSVVVSSSEMPTAFWPRCAKIASQLSQRADRISPAGLSRSSTRIVSKKFSPAIESPASSRAAASDLCRPCTLFRNRAQAAWAMINRIHRCDHGEENLGGADVTGGFVAANVLFAGLEREPICRAAVGIVRNADEPSRHVALVGIPRRKISGVRVRQNRAERRSVACCPPPRPRRFRPGGFNRVSARISAATTRSAPASCAALANGS